MNNITLEQLKEIILKNTSTVFMQGSKGFVQFNWEKIAKELEIEINREGR